GKFGLGRLVPALAAEGDSLKSAALPLAGGDGPAAAADKAPAQGRRGDRDGRRLRAALAAALLRVGVEPERERRAHLHRLLRVLLQPRRHGDRQDARVTGLFPGDAL